MKLSSRILNFVTLFAAFACVTTTLGQNPLRELKLPAEGVLKRQDSGAASPHDTQVIPARPQDFQVEQGGTMPPEVRNALFPEDRDSTGASNAPSPTELTARQNLNPIQPRRINQSAQFQSMPLNGAQDQGSTIETTIHDSNIQPAVHEEAAKNDLAPVVEMLDSIKPGSIVPQRDSADLETLERSLESLGDNAEKKKPLANSEEVAKSQSKLQDVAEKVIYNTMIVLSIGVGFVLVAKQFLKPKKASSKNENSNEFNVVSSMKLAPKVTLMLVEVGDDRLVVATDPTGIKSVVRLTESFATTLGAMDGSADAEMRNEVERELSGSVGTYSLSTIGNSVARETPTKARPESKKDEEAIRKKMEEALAEHGLKDFLLNTIKANQ